MMQLWILNSMGNVFVCLVYSIHWLCSYYIVVIRIVDDQDIIGVGLTKQSQDMTN